MIENDQLLQTTHFNANLIRATDHWAFLGMNHSWAHMGFFWKILWLRTNVNTFNYYALNFINSKCILMLIIFLKKTPKSKKKNKTAGNMSQTAKQIHSARTNMLTCELHICIFQFL